MTKRLLTDLFPRFVKKSQILKKLEIQYLSSGPFGEGLLEKQGKRVYLKPGEQAPEGANVQTGPQGGKYYDESGGGGAAPTEDYGYPGEPGQVEGAAEQAMADWQEENVGETPTDASTYDVGVGADEGQPLDEDGYPVGAAPTGEERRAKREEAAANLGEITLPEEPYPGEVGGQTSPPAQDMLSEISEEFNRNLPTGLNQRIEALLDTPQLTNEQSVDMLREISEKFNRSLPSGLNSRIESLLESEAAGQTEEPGLTGEERRAEQYSPEAVANRAKQEVEKRKIYQTQVAEMQGRPANLDEYGYPEDYLGTKKPYEKIFSDAGMNVQEPEAEAAGQPPPPDASPPDVSEPTFDGQGNIQTPGSDPYPISELTGSDEEAVNALGEQYQQEGGSNPSELLSGYDGPLTEDGVQEYMQDQAKYEDAFISDNDYQNAIDFASWVGEKAGSGPNPQTLDSPDGLDWERSGFDQEDFHDAVIEAQGSEHNTDMAYSGAQNWMEENEIDLNSPLGGKLFDYADVYSRERAQESADYYGEDYALMAKMMQKYNVDNKRRDPIVLSNQGGRQR